MGLFGSRKNSTTANTTNTTENQDNSVITESGAALSMSRSTGNTVSISSTQTDHGTVDRSFDFAMKMAESAAEANESAMNAVGKSADKAISTVASAYENEAATLKDAYETAKAGEQKMFGIAIFGLMAVVLIKVFGTK